MRLLGRLSVLVALSSCAVMVMAAGTEHVDRAELHQQRLQIDAETRRREADFAAELAACATLFAVTDCSDDVRRRRRATLEPLRERRLALDDAERSARASARRDAIEKKRRTQRPSVPEPPPPAPMVAPAPPASSPLIVIKRQPAPARQDAASEAAALRAAASARRQKEGEKNAARVRERIAQRERSGKSAAPLPTPSSPTALR